MPAATYSPWGLTFEFELFLSHAESISISRHNTIKKYLADSVDLEVYWTLNKETVS